MNNPMYKRHGIRIRTEKLNCLYNYYYDYLYYYISINNSFLTEAEIITVHSVISGDHQEMIRLEVMCRACKTYM